MRLYAFGPFRLDAEQLLLTCDGEPVALGPKVVETLLALLESPGEVLAKKALLKRVWPEGYIDEANLAQNIYVLRKALRPHLQSDPIRTVPRRGYRFVAPVSLVEPQRSDLRPESATPTILLERMRGFSMRRFAFAVGAVLVVFVGLSVMNLAGLARTPKTPTGLSGRAQRFYTIGRYYWNQRTAPGLRRSIAYFARVIDVDPERPQGYAGVADADVLLADYHFGPLPSKTYLRRGEAYARKALAVDPKSGEAMAALGLIAIVEKHYGAAEAQLNRAIAANPHYAAAHEWYGILLLQRARGAEALAQLRLAAQEDPLSTATLLWLANAAFGQRHYAEAAAYAQQGIDLAPQLSPLYEVLGMAQEAHGEYADAMGTFHQFAAICRCPAEGDALLAHVYASMHEPSKARSELAIAKLHVGSHSGVAYDIAAALVALGEPSRAFDWLARDRESASIARVDPRFDSVRNDKRFRALTNAPS